MSKEEIKKVELLAEKVNIIKKEISKIIIGQQEAVEIILLSVICNGHSLLVGVPGLAKTLLIKVFSKIVDLSFSRIQFTTDLMPSDIIGTEILNEKRAFQFIQGPIFSNILLADEINRTPPKTQSALLEAMQEKKVTINGVSYNLPNPFFVLATQNPIEQEGTYPLPEAQLDRFMFSIFLDYPSFEQEVEIIKNVQVIEDMNLKKVLTSAEIIEFQKMINKIPISDPVIEYAVSLVSRTRLNSPLVSDISRQFLLWGAGPRATQALVRAAKCYACINGRFAPEIDDIKHVAVPILRHRIVKSYKAEAENIDDKKLIDQLL